RAKGKNRFGAEVGAHGVTVFTIEDGKIVRVRDFIFEAHRLKDFWGEELGPGAPGDDCGSPRGESGPL
ncbi:MAG: hypothetical protein K8H90_03865, partial [Thermoanaerobaculia bacterium]|nr:hypothetical protein [Thermoanaerobaculia bacterium]